MKLPKGPLKVILLSPSAVEENARRRTPPFVPPWEVFVLDDDGNAYRSYAAFGFAPAKLTPKVEYIHERPYPWLPTVRPSNYRESLLDIHTWFETTDELTIFEKESQ